MRLPSKVGNCPAKEAKAEEAPKTPCPSPGAKGPFHLVLNLGISGAAEPSPSLLKPLKLGTVFLGVVQAALPALECREHLPLHGGHPPAGRGPPLRFHHGPHPQHHSPDVFRALPAEEPTQGSEDPGRLELELLGSPPALCSDKIGFLCGTPIFKWRGLLSTPPPDYAVGGRGHEQFHGQKPPLLG